MFSWSAIAPQSSSEAGKKALSVGAIVAICICAFALSKAFLGTLCFLRWRKMHTECEVKLSGKHFSQPKDYNFVLSPKSATVYALPQELRVGLGSLHVSEF